MATNFLELSPSEKLATSDDIGLLTGEFHLLNLNTYDESDPNSGEAYYLDKRIEQDGRIFIVSSKLMDEQHLSLKQMPVFAINHAVNNWKLGKYNGDELLTSEETFIGGSSVDSLAFDGSNWQIDGFGIPMASMSQIPTIDNTLTEEGKAADAKATGEALAGKASSADATLTDWRSFSDWTINCEDLTRYGVESLSIEWNSSTFPNTWSLVMHRSDRDFVFPSNVSDANALTLTIAGNTNPSGGHPFTARATRTLLNTGYQLGNQEDMPIVSIAVLNAHASNDTHITAQERSAWNAKSNASHTHSSLVNGSTLLTIDDQSSLALTTSQLPSKMIVHFPAGYEVSWDTYDEVGDSYSVDTQKDVELFGPYKGRLAFEAPKSTHDLWVSQRYIPNSGSDTKFHGIYPEGGDTGGDDPYWFVVDNRFLILCPDPAEFSSSETIDRCGAVFSIKNNRLSLVNGTENMPNSVTLTEETQSSSAIAISGKFAPPCMKTNDSNLTLDENGHMTSTVFGDATVHFSAGFDVSWGFGHDGEEYKTSTATDVTFRGPYEVIYEGEKIKCWVTDDFLQDHQTQPYSFDDIANNSDWYIVEDHPYLSDYSSHLPEPTYMSCGGGGVTYKISNWASEHPDLSLVEGFWWTGDAPVMSREVLRKNLVDRLSIDGGFEAYIDQKLILFTKQCYFYNEFNEYRTVWLRDAKELKDIQDLSVILGSEVGLGPNINLEYAIVQDHDNMWKLVRIDGSESSYEVVDSETLFDGNSQNPVSIDFDNHHFVLHWLKSVESQITAALENLATNGITVNGVLYKLTPVSN